jgi:uncharacterized membrane protein
VSKHRDKIQQNSPRPNTTIELTQQFASFSGPLPHPNILARYNEVIPNGAERIMAMAERQAIHREALETQVVTGNVASQARGTHYAFAICMVCILGGFGLIITGKSVDGLVAIISSLAALAGVFVYGKYQQRKERQEKSEALVLRKRS